MWTALRIAVHMAGSMGRKCETKTGFLRISEGEHMIVEEEHMICRGEHMCSPGAPFIIWMGSGPSAEPTAMRRRSSAARSVSSPAASRMPYIYHDTTP